MAVGQEGLDRCDRRRAPHRFDGLRAVGDQRPARSQPERAGRGRRRHARPQRQADRRLEPGGPLPRDADDSADGEVRTEGRARCRRPQFLQPRGDRPVVHRPRRLGRPDLARRAPGWQHHHAAARQDPAADAGAVDHSQGAGDRARGRARAAVLQGPDPRHVPEPRLLRARRLRSGRRRENVFRQGRQRPDAGPGCVPGRSHPVAGRLRPAGSLRPGAGPPALRAQRDGGDTRSYP